MELVAQFGRGGEKGVVVELLLNTTKKQQKQPIGITCMDALTFTLRLQGRY